uniref:Uncharacterized protein n=1 Tax=Aceria tosichella TaxID=561515 RepID=A0A6G1SJ05_9ACAR
MSLDPTSTTPSKEPPTPASLSEDKSRSNSGAELKLNDEKNGTFQIFLGGSCNPTTWRQSVAIPYLEMNGITYYNPQVDNWTPELVKTERHAKQSAQVLLFVLDEQTRSTVSLVESAFMAGEGKKLVLVIYPFEYDVLSLTDTTKQTTSNIVETRSALTKTTSRKSTSPKRENITSSSVLQSSSTSSSKTVSSTIKHASGTIKINGEIISIAEFQELRQARFILQNLVDKRNTAMFSDIPQALDYVTKCLAVDKNNRDDEICTNSTFAKEDQEFELSASDSDIKPIESASSNQNANQYPPSDVYLMLDDYDDKNIESSLILMLRERGLSYNYRPLRDIINHGHLPKCTSLLPNDQTLSLTKDQQEIDRVSGLLDTRGEQCTRLSLIREINTTQSSRVLLLIITNKCRGLSVMVLASYFMALFRDNVVLCIQYLEEPCLINGELLSKNAIADYNRGRVYLCDYAMKSQVPVFKTIREAVDCCSQRCGTRNIKD